MTDEQDRNEEAQRRAGLRRVYRSEDGTYQVEQAPGAGPQHHDDVELTIEDVERKDRGDDPSRRLTIEGIEDGPTLAPTAEHRRVMDLGAMAEQMNRKLLVVTDPHGRLAATYPGTEAAHAHAHARALGGLLAELPIIADYR